MATLKFKCESCGRVLKADEKYAGATVRCPNCQANLIIPATQRAHESAVTEEMASTVQNGPQTGQGAATAEPPSMSVDDLRDPREGLARTILLVLAIPVWLLLILWVVSGLGISLIFIGIFALVAYLGRLFSLAYIKTFAVRTSPQQFPEIYNAATKVCEKLNIETPGIYVMQDSIWNAFATKLAGERIVVLLSGAVDAILLKGDTSQLTWLVGHGIGHHAAGHIGVWHGLIMMGAWLPWFALWYRRRGELTCDRIGLYASGNASASIKAMCNMIVGAQLADLMNVEEAIKQWQEHKSEIFVRYRVLYSSHPPNLFRMKRLTESVQELGCV